MTKTLNDIRPLLAEAEADALPIIRPAELASALGLSQKTLSNWRAESRGPRFVRMGGGRTPAVYRVSDVMEWLERSRVDDTYWAA